MAEITLGQSLYYPEAANIDTDFIGFTFGGIHSSSFGIVRTSDGSRFNENLLPSFQDKTVQIPGGDGTYYFGSYFAQRQFDVPFAFDSLTDSNFRKLKQWFGNKKIKDLIFDEAPYKLYRARIGNSATMKHICFEENGERVYKGEGDIQFICYEPFARSRREVGSKTLEFYDLAKFPTRAQWIQTSGILTKAQMADINVFNTQHIAKIYNPGDLECDFTLVIKFTSGKIAGRKFWIQDTTNKELSIKDIVQKGTDVSIKIDSKTNLIVGLDSTGSLSGNTYNEYIESGHFFKIPLCSLDDDQYFRIANKSDDVTLDYNWLYF